MYAMKNRYRYRKRYREKYRERYRYRGREGSPGRDCALSCGELWYGGSAYNPGGVCVAAVMQE